MIRVCWMELISAIWLCGCVGTSTGNPYVDRPIVVPKGAKLVMSDASREANPKVSDAAFRSLGEGNRTFAFDLYAELAKEDKNLFFSPLSISMASAMTYAGAEGDTESEMREVFHFSLPAPDLHVGFDAIDIALKTRATELPSDSKGDGFELSIVNQIWGQKGYKFLDSYLDVLAVNYGAGIFLVDFAEAEPTRKLINDWVSEHTEKRITNLLPENSIDVLTRLLLTNAIYFKASWLSKFDPNRTSNSVFHAPSAEQTVPMMYQTLDANYVENDTYQAVELPYLSDSTCMLVLLPVEGQFETVASELNEELFQQILATLDNHSVILTMPRFTIESEQRLKAPLQKLGMRNAFGDNADFSGLDGTSQLYIHDIYHKAFIVVDEEGTEATAATVEVIKGKGEKPSAELNLNRPFIFLIYDNPTGQILFLGYLKEIAS